MLESPHKGELTVDTSDAFLRGSPGQRQEFLQKQLAVLRERNDGQLDPIETAHIRGQISFIKKLQGLEQTPAPVAASHLGYET